MRKIAKTMITFMCAFVFMMMAGTVSTQASLVSGMNDVINGGDWYYFAWYDNVETYDITESSFTIDFTKLRQRVVNDDKIKINSMDVTVTNFLNEDEVLLNKKESANIGKITFYNCQPGVVYNVWINMNGKTSNGMDISPAVHVVAKTYGEYGEESLPISSNGIVVTPEVDDKPQTGTTIKTSITPKIKSVTLGGYSGNEIKWSLDSKIAKKIDGIEYKIINKSKKKTVKKGVSYKTADYDYIPSYTPGIYYIQFRSYYQDYENNKKVYSPWTKSSDSKAYVIGYPKLLENKTRKSIKKDSVTISWKSVKGAKSYTVYGRHKKSGKWYKLKTIKGTSLKVDKIHGKKINTTKNVYFKIVTNTTVNGKTLKSMPYPFYVYSFYY